MGLRVIPLDFEEHMLIHKARKQHAGLYVDSHHGSGKVILQGTDNLEASVAILGN